MMAAAAPGTVHRSADKSITHTRRRPHPALKDSDTRVVAQHELDLGLRPRASNNPQIGFKRTPVLVARGFRRLPQHLLGRQELAGLVETVICGDERRQPRRPKPMPRRILDPGQPYRLRNPTGDIVRNAVWKSWCGPEHRRRVSRHGSMLIGYARVSTDDQTLDLQRDALKEAGCERIFEDTVGGTAERPNLQQALSHLRAGDTLVSLALGSARSIAQGPHRPS